LLSRWSYRQHETVPIQGCRNPKTGQAQCNTSSPAQPCKADCLGNARFGAEPRVDYSRESRNVDVFMVVGHYEPSRLNQTHFLNAAAMSKPCCGCFGGSNSALRPM